MLKGQKKYIGLIAVTTSIISFIPIFSYSSYAATIRNENGSVSEAIAYSDGKFCIKGSGINNDTAEKLYFYNGSKYTELNNLDYSSELDSYSQYAVSSNKYIDLSTGKILSDDVFKDNITHTSNALRKNIFNDNINRYTNGVSIDQEDDGVIFHLYSPDEYINDFIPVPGTYYEKDPWYLTQYNITDPNSNLGYFYPIDVVFTNSEGKYIIADYSLGNLNMMVLRHSISTTSANVTVDMNNTESNNIPVDTYIDTDENTQNLTDFSDIITQTTGETVFISSTALSNESIIIDDFSAKNTTDIVNGYKANIMHAGIFTSDESYIYRPATLYITKGKFDFVTENVRFGNRENPIAIKAPSGEWLTRECLPKNSPFSLFLAKDLIDDCDIDTTPVFAIPMIQKISKNQSSSTADGLKYPETVENYILADDEGNLKYNNDLLSKQFTQSNGKLISYSYEDNKLTVNSISLKNENGYSYTDFSNSITYTLDNENCYTLDSKGNLYILKDNNIMKYNPDTNDFINLYTVNKPYNNFSVYDENNIIAWNNSEQVFSIISDIKSTSSSSSSSHHRSSSHSLVSSDTDSNQTNTSDTVNNTEIDNNISIKTNTGWKKIDGLWYYINSDGSMATGWLLDGSTWYYLNPDGSMAAGWLLDGSTWYYLNPDGSMATGWLLDGSTWYYLNPDGSMAADSYVDGYYVGANGALY